MHTTCTLSVRPSTREYLGCPSTWRVLGATIAYMYMSIDVHVRTMYAWGVTPPPGQARDERGHNQCNTDHASCRTSPLLIQAREHVSHRKDAVNISQPRGADMRLLDTSKHLEQGTNPAGANASGKCERGAADATGERERRKAKAREREARARARSRASARSESECEVRAAPLLEAASASTKPPMRAARESVERAKQEREEQERQARAQSQVRVPS